MKTYEIIFKQDMQTKSVTCTKYGLENMIKTIEDDNGEVIEVKLRKKAKTKHETTE